MPENLYFFFKERDQKKKSEEEEGDCVFKATLYEYRHNKYKKIYTKQKDSHANQTRSTVHTGYILDADFLILPVCTSFKPDAIPYY